MRLQPPRRLRRPRRLLAGIRRRPRTVGAIGLVLLVASIGVFGLVTSPRGADSPTVGPSFSYAGTWDLLDLQRHIDAGEVVAITAVANGGTDAGDASVLLAKLRDGQIIRVATDVSASQAADALANLGHGDLLTQEAWQAVKAARASSTATDPLRSLAGILFPLILLGVLTVVLVRVIGRQQGGTRESASRFTTILPLGRRPTASWRMASARRRASDSRMSRAATRRSSS